MDRRKKIVNLHEEKTRLVLNEAASSHGAQVFVKVRIADVLNIDSSGLSHELYRYALRAHFDFVVAAADSRALFAVEFDGPKHLEPAQRKKDAQKDAICETLGLPLLRITSDFLTRRLRKFTVLGWLVNLWFLSEAFYEAQNGGSVPPDEPFLYFSILGDSVDELREKGATFPYDPSLSSRLLVAETYKKGLCRDFCPTVFTADDPQGRVIGLAVIRVTEHEAVVGQASCQIFRFAPVSPDDLSEELASIDAADKLRRYLAGELCSVRLEHVAARVATMDEWAKRSGRASAFRGGVELNLKQYSANA